MAKEKLKIRKVEDYFSTKETRFFTLLLKTEKWKELYSQAESMASIVISMGFIVFVYFVYHNIEFNKFINMIMQIMQILIGAATGMLGFIISGLAIFTGTITDKLVKAIDSDEKIDGLVGILFSFYFIGAIIGFSILVYIVSYVLLWIDLPFALCPFFIISIVVSYLFTFSILYSVSLLGTCIRMFFISCKYSR